VPLIPGITDDDANVDATAAFVHSLPGVHAVSLLPYHKPAMGKHEKYGVPWRMNGAEEIPADRLEAIAARLTHRDLRVDIGG